MNPPSSSINSERGKYPPCIAFNIYAQYMDMNGPAKWFLETAVYCEEGYKPVNSDLRFEILPKENFDASVHDRMDKVQANCLNDAQRIESIPSLAIYEEKIQWTKC